MNVFETELRSLRHNVFWYHWTECTHGILLAAASYLFVCVGPGIIPWRVADYFVLMGFGGVCLSATSIAQDQRWSWHSLIPPIILAPFYIVFLLGYGFVSGLPGTEWTTRDSSAGFILFPIIAITSHVARRPRSIAIILTSFLLTLCAGTIGIYLLTAHEMQKEIALTLVRGGCVVSTGKFNRENPRLISAVGDVKIGIANTASDRVYFIIKSNVESWSYSAIEAQQPYYFDKEILKLCSNKKGGISAAP